jgi:hypothetical protein
VIRLAFLVGLLGLGACSFDADVPGLAFPRYTVRDTVPAALNEGTLVNRGGCLVLEGEGTWVLLWPEEDGVVREGGLLTILDGGRAVATVGAHVVVSRGELAETSEASQQVDALPAGCQVPPYWMVTGIEKGSIQVGS